ncbi:uncharacterized protein [Leptinotarsa decemlineata]|uniref:uncharacterized protein n=1 Tax=Leptinotarsa decemlineata TaxID=7539 RepID=UPI003D30B417
MSIGKLEPFKFGESSFTTYIARIGQYFKANQVKDEMKTAILITAVGDETFELMVENKSYEDLVKLVVNHLQPTPSEIAERYKFRQRKQEPSESIACYVAVPKKLSKNCNFGTNLETELRDQVVFGLKNDIIRQRLFQETNLTYVKAYDLAINLEAAEINSGMICTNNQSAASILPEAPPMYPRNSNEIGRHLLEKIAHIVAEVANANIAEKEITVALSFFSKMLFVDFVKKEAI